MGMSIADGVRLPDSTSVDASHCYLISIEKGCTFGEECFLLAHDAQMDEFLDAGRLGRIVIREGSHLGHRTMVLPGVEVGPRTIVLPNSLVTKALPPETLCGGSPAKVICTLDEYREEHREDRIGVPTLSPEDLEYKAKTPEGRDALREELRDGGYVWSRRR